MSDKSDAPWVTTLRTMIPCYDGSDVITAPPEQVLDVCVVAERVFLDICTYEEDFDTTTTTAVAKASVDAGALLNALIAQMGIERVRMALPLDVKA